jgi:hypothetical protein
VKKLWPQVKLGEVLVQNHEYVDIPEPRLYPKLSVRLYGKGVVLDAPADGTVLKMKRHQLARAGQVILSEIWRKKVFRFSRKWRGAVPGKVVCRPSGGDFQGIGVFRSDGITGHVRASAACSFRATYSSIRTARTWFIR